MPAPLSTLRCCAFLPWFLLPSGAAPPPDAVPLPPPAQSSEQEVPEDGVLEARGMRIGSIVVRNQDIFDPSDPKEDRRLFRLANRLHRETRPEVITEQLLVHPGDAYSRRALDESERVLRRNRYLYDAQIRPLRVHGDEVDVEIVTRDVWTLKVNAGLSRSGGANSTRFQLQDANLFGTGKSLTVERATDVDRTRTLVRYDDHNLFGSRYELGAAYSSNSDGHAQHFDLGRPFYSLDARWSGRLDFDDEDSRVSLYRLGHVAERFQHRRQGFELGGGWSQGLHGGWVRRLSVGLAYQKDEQDPLADAASPRDLPGERILSYPWFAVDWLEDSFEETHNLNQLHRTEDLHLGTELHARLGLSNSALGATADALVFAGSASKGFHLGPRQTLLFNAETSGRWTSSGAENLLASASGRFFARDFGEQLFVAALETGYARHLDPENQLLLGGDSGLRGYPLRYQDGDGRVLFTVEQRVFTSWQPLHLFYVGGAVFADVGRTFAGSDALSPNLGWLADVGFGLRLASSRSGLGSVLHIDLAFPLNAGGTIDRVQFLISTKAGF